MTTHVSMKTWMQSEMISGLAVAASALMEELNGFSRSAQTTDEISLPSFRLIDNPCFSSRL